MTFLYWIVAHLALLLLSPYALLRALFGDRCWRERLTLVRPASPAALWIHASSVGEVRVISYLVDYLKRERPELSVHVTVATRNGYATAASILPTTCTVSFIPLDIPWLMSRTIDRLRPTLIIIAETEIWPHLVACAHGRSVPIVLVNGRMTERAYRRYCRAKNFFSSILSTYDRFFFKTQADASRYASFGVPSDKSIIAGDMKFDAPLVERSDVTIRNLRESIGVAPDQYLLVAGSTRPGEEAILARVYTSLKVGHHSLRLALAPRHLERLREIQALLQAENLSISLYSEMMKGEQSSDSGSVILVDTMGNLSDLYLAADLAFVGGTLVNVGGHNLLEPVWAGTPVLFGPHVSNVRDAADYLLQNKFGCLVNNADELRETIDQLISGSIVMQAKTQTDLRHSATAIAGEYIVRKLDA